MMQSVGYSFERHFIAHRLVMNQRTDDDLCSIRLRKFPQALSFVSTIYELAAEYQINSVVSSIGIPMNDLT